MANISGSPKDQRILEEAGYRYCYDCASWEDDTGCFPDDHSRHCYHWLKDPANPLLRVRCAEGPR